MRFPQTTHSHRLIAILECAALLIVFLKSMRSGTHFGFTTAGRSFHIPKVMLILVCTIASTQLAEARCIRGNCTNGKGVLITESGDHYSGFFKNARLEGKGYWKSRHGDVYRGAFANGISHGKGKLSLANGDVYIGDFKNGKFHGKGKYTFHNGDSYIGNWSAGQMHGSGTYYHKSGGFLDGEYAHGKLVERHQSPPPPASQTFNEGATSELVDITKDCTYAHCHQELGVFRYGDGTRYLGEFRNGLPSGQGRCEFANGDVYEGEWEGHAPNGRGILTFASGRKHAAIWKQGVPVEQLLEDHDYLPKFDKPQKTYDDDVDVYALVVGVATYQHMPSLKYTDDDAYQLYAFLKSPEGGAIPNDNIKVLVDDVATKNNILMSMEQLFSKADENDVVLLYMSGHGLEGSFVPSDFDGYNNQIPYNTITEILNQSQAKHKLCIADACHSGSLVNTTKGSSYAPALNNYYRILQDLEAGGTAMLLSSSAQEVSLEYSGLRQGVFTHFLMNGLRGSADSDNDKVVTISELYHYMYKGVTEYTQYQQTPILTGTYNAQMPVAVIR